MATSSPKAEPFVGPLMRASAWSRLNLRRTVVRLKERLQDWLRAPGTPPWHIFLSSDFPEVGVVEWRSPAGDGGRGPLDALPQAARRGSVRVWTPARETLLTVAHWPVRGRGRLVQALPYLLEDQLLMEPEYLAFSHKETEAGIFVAVTAKERLSAWRAALDQERLSASLCPVTLALPIRAHSWSCRFADGQWAVRTGPYSGFGAAGHREHAPAAFLQALEAARKHDAGPESVTLFEGDEALRAMLAADLLCPVVADPRLIGEGETPAFRLGETGGAVSATGLAALKALRPALIVVALALVLGFTHTLFEWVRLAHQESQVQAEMTALFTKSFPNAPVLDPATQMRQGVRKLSGRVGGGGDSFLSLMTWASPALSSLAQGSLTRLHYRHGQLRAAVRLANFDALATLKKHLMRVGLVVRVTHVMSHHGGVQAQVTIRRRSS
ncbi:MAG: type II secretion system protein GspL [Acidiferrobacter sp.]